MKYRNVAEPFGLFRISHSAFLATDTFRYNGKTIPSDNKYRGNDTQNCINILGAWEVDGKLVFDFGKSGLADCTQTNDGRLILRSDDDIISPLQGFFASIFKVDADFALKAARQRHLKEPTGAESGTSTTSGDLLAGYLGVPWGSSFEDTSRHFAAQGAARYSETRVSEARVEQNGKW